MSIYLANTDLDFTDLHTPKQHGAILVAPDPNAWIDLARRNHDALRRASFEIAGIPLGEWRQRTRKSLLGTDDRLVFAIGHQPEFIHPGVWAKHVVAARAARASGGIPYHLIVDTDAAQNGYLRVPVQEKERWRVRRLSVAGVGGGQPWEFARGIDRSRVNELEKELRTALGDEEFERTGMPAWFDAVRAHPQPCDWVGQATAGRRAIDAAHHIDLVEGRVSTAWCMTLVLDMLQNARKFGAVYNRALTQYREEFNVRGNRRPMPDLFQNDGRLELPLWAQHADEPRRRLFVVEDRADLKLLAGDRVIKTLVADRLNNPDFVTALAGEMGEWTIRPRALALTIWARLLLADLFIHGIGGAKYDRISDRIMADYYGVEPPALACVSATLHLRHLEGANGDLDEQRARGQWRDLYWNPQRHVPSGPRVGQLKSQREEAVRRSEQLRRERPRDRAARRRVFEEIRDLNQALRATAPELDDARRQDVERATKAGEQRAVGADRTFFIGLHRTAQLAELCAALPDASAFRV